MYLGLLTSGGGAQNYIFLYEVHRVSCSATKAEGRNCLLFLTFMYDKSIS
nr:MAG TPA: hypothetical protein [Caudoviricetes sp.]